MSPKISLLIVDDEEELCRTLSDILRGKGYEAEWATTGKAAIEKLKQKPFNIALMDIKLPDIEGTELLQVLKEINPELEVIMITGHASVESSVKALRQGAFDYIMKPVAPEELFPTIDKAVEKQRALNERRGQLAREIKKREVYRSLAIIDGLTGLYNQRHFRELLSREIASAKRYAYPFALLMIDIDDFKEYNDRYGHPAGDKLLKRVSQILKQECRSSDFVARYGGDEFTIVLPHVSKDTATLVAERLGKAVEQTEQNKSLTISTGAACYPQDAEDEEQLISRADQALYQAKRGGRNQTRIWGTG